MSRVHLYVGYIVPAAFALLAIGGVWAFIRNRAPSSWFWNVLALVQVILGIQILVGLILFVSGLEPPGEMAWLHYAYGGLFPAFLLIMGHRFARRHQDVAWVVFGLVGLVNFGLTLRALMTGLGSG